MAGYRLRSPGIYNIKEETTTSSQIHSLPFCSICRNSPEPGHLSCNLQIEERVVPHHYNSEGIAALYTAGASPQSYWSHTRTSTTITLPKDGYKMLHNWGLTPQLPPRVQRNNLPHKSRLLLHLTSYAVYCKIVS